jgi:protein SCO1/2
MCRADYSVVMFSPASRPAHLLGLFLLIGGLPGCTAEPGRSFPLRGQIMAVGGPPRTDGRRELTVKHEDIPGFMPAMTMGYSVKEPPSIDGLQAGDLVTATLVFDQRHGDMYLRDLKKTGHADLPADAHAVRIMDVMNPGDEVPDDPLQDQSGASRKLSDWRGRAVAVTFVYTRCPLPDFCPAMDRRFGELQAAIAADARLRDRIHLVSVSFDPAHDTPAVIQAHAKARGADPRTWSYLTGTAAAIDHFTSRFGVSTIVDQDKPEALTHNLRTAVIDRRGRLVKILSGNDWTVPALLADLRDASGT